MTPLADKIRPTTLDEIVGQPHLLAPGKPLRRILERGQVTNMIFYGTIRRGENHPCPDHCQQQQHDPV